ncbi:tripartite tricarboxylate transporter TctB family protein [Halopiger aswanensis]|uniref:Tripartite tricarboxylate transporter TctB family protein n=1 Tax=Halopiger aswanensis TaxID=148449 RepID=A0A3R7FVQ1_9EURY|nr:tripartite tricarboxylate transporter TctB family protein [Halopiger aswanensis]RKD95171.1 tripartite tricarboxylate transporter TctB family protein [Halopiger aswanensis]
MVDLRHTDKIGSGLFLALAAGIFVVTADFPQGIGETGPAYYPRVLAALLAGFALLQLGWSLKRDGVRSHEIDPAAAKRVVGAFLLVVCYVLLLPWFGFVLTTVGFLAVSMWYSGVRSPLRLAAVAVGLTVLLYYVFVVFLRVPLPESPLIPVARYLPSVVWAPSLGVLH